MHDDTTEYVVESPVWWRISLREYWKYRELFYFLAWRDILVKYKQTVLGILWAILQPLALMVLFTVFWSRVIQVKTGALPYPLFAYSGLILWGLFDSGVRSSAGSLLDNSNLVKKIFFPRAIIPLSSMVVALFDFAMTFVVWILLVCCYGMASRLPALVCWLPLGLAIILLSGTGLGLALAGINVKYRDFRYVIPFLMQVLFFSTAVIFPVSLFKGQPVITVMMMANPVSCAIELVRGALAGDVQPAQAVSGMVVASVMFLAGLTVFKKAEVGCADIL